MKTPIRLTALALSTLFLSACGGKDPAAQAMPDAPDQVILHVAKSMEQNDPSAAWHMLPASYQTELNGVVRSFAAAMDADIWNAGTSVIGKFQKVLTQQKPFILSSSMGAMAGDPAVLEQTHAQISSLLTILTKSDLMDLEKLRQADLGSILATTGADLMKAGAEMQDQAAPAAGNFAVKDPFTGSDLTKIKDAFTNMKAEVVSQDADQALVRISVPDEAPEEVQFVRVEGKWLPKDLADEWPGMIEEMKAGLAELGTIPPEQKSQVLMMTGMAGGVLDQLLAAKTQQEFDAVLSGLMGMMMGGGM